MGQAAEKTNSMQLEEPLTFVEVMPEYPGGDEALYSFIGNTIRYPPEAMDKRIQGTVMIQFVVEKNGELSNFNVLKSPHASLTNESIKMLKKMPKWSPGKNNGKPVRVYFTLPIIFKLEGK